MDIVVEILIEIYMELMFLIIPEKNVGPKHIRLVKILAVLVFFGLAALFVWGMVLVTDEGDPLGYIPIGIAAAVSLAQIIAGIVLYKKHH